MSGSPPLARLVSVDIEADTSQPQQHNNNKDSRSLAKVAAGRPGGGEVNGNCVLDEGFDSIQTYQGD
jgi:hypothetical protein